MAKESLQNEAKLLAAKTSELESNLEALESTKKLLENEKQLGLKNKTLVQSQTKTIESLSEQVPQTFKLVGLLKIFNVEISANNFAF